MARTIQPEILDEFIREAKGYIPVIRRELNAWIADPSRIEHIGEAHRLIHSIKGSASMMGYSALGHIGYYVEECLEELAPGQMEWNEGASRVLRKTIDTIEYYLSAITSGTLQDRPLVAEVVSNFRRVRGLPESGDQAESER